MSKIIAAFNMTLDGICDHTAGIPDAELHQHYADLIDQAGAIFYGRTTYKLMQYWQTILDNPVQETAMNDFARSIHRIPKVVFSSTIQDTGWDSALLAQRPLKEEVMAYKQASEKDILIGSRSLIIQLLQAQFIDEFQLCIHPLIQGSGMRLFEDLRHSILLNTTKIKPLASGSVVIYYEPVKT